MGGLGIKKTKDMNRALVAKLTWEVASNAKKLWVKMFQKKYVRGKNFMKMPMPKSISWSSQSIFGCRDVVKKGFCHKIGSEWNTWILENPWVPEESDFTPKVKSGVVLTEYLVANLNDQDSLQWDRGKLAELFIPKLIGFLEFIYHTESPKVKYFGASLH